MDESLAVAKSPIVLNPSNAERPERSLSLSSPSVPIDCLVFDSRGQRLAAVSKRTDTVFVGKVDELVRNALSNIQRSDLWMALNFSAQHLPTSAQWRPISCPAMLAVAANNCALIWRLNSNQSNGPVVRVLNVPSAAVALAWAPHGLYVCFFFLFISRFLIVYI
jgi:hypothetical protein